MPADLRIRPPFLFGFLCIMLMSHEAIMSHSGFVTKAGQRTPASSVWLYSPGVSSPRGSLATEPQLCHAQVRSLSQALGSVAVCSWFRDCDVQIGGRELTARSIARTAGGDTQARRCSAPHSTRSSPRRMTPAMASMMPEPARRLSRASRDCRSLSG